LAEQDADAGIGFSNLRIADFTGLRPAHGARRKPAFLWRNPARRLAGERRENIWISKLLSWIASIALCVNVLFWRFRAATAALAAIHRFTVGLKPRYKNLSAHPRATGNFESVADTSARSGMRA